jgi:hypothetical protein
LIFISYIIQTSSQNFDETKFISKLFKTIHESDAINLINEIIYIGANISSLDPVRLMSRRHWIRATRLIADYLNDLTKAEVQNELRNILEESKTYLNDIKYLLKDKKKNIVTISPIFEWSQDNELVKIRIKFAKNLESPGEKDIQNFKVECKRNYLTVHGYKQHEEYVAYYYRKIHLYDFIRHHSCKSYKETDGTFIIKLVKNQPTLYWNYLDQITDDHSNMYTWFDVFTSYDDKAKYTEFREFAMQNLLEKDLNDWVTEKSEDKKQRLEKIERLFEYFRTKDSENKNYCNSPVNESYCLLNDIYDWNYWLS